MIGALSIAAVALALLALRQNLLVVLGVACGMAYGFWGDGQVQNIINDAWDGLNRDVLLSIPMYLLAGAVMARGAIARRLIRLARALSAPIPGGLAIATVLSCAMFAAVTGSGTVALLAIGAVMYPALLEAGYSKRFALGALCAAGTLGIVVPPSIPLILYGIMTQTSISELFIAGVGPALLLTGLMSVWAIVRNWRFRLGRWRLQEIGTAFIEGIWSLLMPVIILGGIYTGWFTATESASIAVVYGFLVEIVIHREMRFKEVVEVFTSTTRLMGSLFPVLMMALALNVFLTYEQVPDMAVEWLSARIDSLPGFILLMNAFLLLVGCFMDIGSAILILSPLLQPIAVSQGMDAVHFGVVMVVNLEMGYLTPPMGLNLIVAMTAFNESFGEICRAVLPFLLLMLAALVTVSFWPGLSLFLLQ